MALAVLVHGMVQTVLQGRYYGHDIPLGVSLKIQDRLEGAPARTGRVTRRRGAPPSAAGVGRQVAGQRRTVPSPLCWRGARQGLAVKLLARVRGFDGGRW